MDLKIVKIFTILFSLFGSMYAQPSLQIPEHFEISEYPALAERIINHLENHGYPFATVSLRAADPENGDMTPRIIIDTNIFVTFDSIVLKGDVKLSKAFIYPYLGLKHGMPYNEKIMKSVPAKLEELPFATIIRECGVAFVKDKSYLYLYLDKRQTNQFDGYVGLVPVDERTGKVAVNGELNLSLQNLFRIGETVSLKWLSSERYSQYLQVNLKFPYIFRMRFGLDFAFHLDKVDTSYLTLDLKFGIPYAFLNNSYIEPYFHHIGSTILNHELIDFDSDTSFIDFRKNLYGLRMHFRKLDYLFNPRRGIDFFADISAGQRTILPNNHLESAFYDTLSLQKTSFHLMGEIRGYIPLGRYFVLAPHLQAGTLLSGTHYHNELYKISGENKLRGFNENDLRASTYLLYSMEFRYIFGKRSYAHLFFDGGAYEQQTTTAYCRDFPFGFGLGVNLSVRAGTFYIEYALGRQHKNPISFKTGVIHFGIKVDF